MDGSRGGASRRAVCEVSATTTHEETATTEEEDEDDNDEDGLSGHVNDVSICRATYNAPLDQRGKC